MSNVRKDLGESNLKLAQENLKSEKVLVELREKYEKLALILKSLQDEVAAKRDIRDKLMSKYSGAAVLSKLNQAAKEAEDESDEISGKFLSKEIEYDVFSKKYLDLRILYHDRKTKIDLLTKDKGKVLASLFPTSETQ